MKISEPHSSEKAGKKAQRQQGSWKPSSLSLSRLSSPRVIIFSYFSPDPGILIIPKNKTVGSRKAVPWRVETMNRCRNIRLLGSFKVLRQRQTRPSISVRSWGRQVLLWFQLRIEKNPPLYWCPSWLLVVVFAKFVWCRNQADIISDSVLGPDYTGALRTCMESREFRNSFLSPLPLIW